MPACLSGGDTLSGLSLIGWGFFFALPDVGGLLSNDGLEEGFFFAFSFLRAFNKGKTRVNPEEVVVVVVVVPRWLTKEEESAALFIPASYVIAPSVLVHGSYRKVKDFYMHIKKKNICDISSKDTTLNGRPMATASLRFTRLEQLTKTVTKMTLTDVDVGGFNTHICQSLLVVADSMLDEGSSERPPSQHRNHSYHHCKSGQDCILWRRSSWVADLQVWKSLVIDYWSTLTCLTNVRVSRVWVLIWRDFIRDRDKGKGERTWRKMNQKKWTCGGAAGLKTTWEIFTEVSLTIDCNQMALITHHASRLAPWLGHNLPCSILSMIPSLSYMHLHLNLTGEKDAAPMPTEDVHSQAETSKVHFIVLQSPLLPFVCFPSDIIVAFLL